jgi:hypothetical protein
MTSFCSCSHSHTMSIFSVVNSTGIVMDGGKVGWGQKQQAADLLDCSASRHDDLGYLRYSSTYSKPRYRIEVDGQLHATVPFV